MKKRKNAWVDTTKVFSRGMLNNLKVGSGVLPGIELGSISERIFTVCQLSGCVNTVYNIDVYI